jgi:hypothetical protein
MKQKLNIIAVLFVVAMGVVLLAVPKDANAEVPPGPPGDRIVVYVESQGLFYDSIVLTNLPMEGKFQQLRPGEGPGGTLATDFGPGDPGYLGGRWWKDDNGNGEMDEEDSFFSCPLLGVGSATPPA